ncbi:MAG: hypothetical protein ACREPD_05405 [Stenotrophomonas sp.]|uniref:hypothetical protein n=1 Tax=Stenotrophomonas sp. TaxID=69392 RepID=UPI003D6D50D4
MAIVDIGYEKWQKDFESQYPDLFKEGSLTGPGTALRRDLMRTAYMAGKKAACQPAGEAEPFCYLGEYDADYIERNRPGQAQCVLFKGRHPKKSVPLFRVAAPAQQPAQAVDLGQFREAVECWLCDSRGAMRRASNAVVREIFQKHVADAEGLLALIDSQSSAQGVG